LAFFVRTKTLGLFVDDGTEQVVGDIVIHGAAENKRNEDGAHKDIAAAAKMENETAAHLFTYDLHSDSTAWVQPGGETANWQSLGEEDKIEVQVAAVSSTTEEEETRPASVWYGFVPSHSSSIQL
jgi:hypothetical protein